MMNNRSVSVIGAGLAGSEAAWQLASRGIKVTLYEMRPFVYSPAHHTDWFAELVCSNSFRGDKLSNAVGLLKEEMRKLDSLIMKWADQVRVPAGDSTIRFTFKAPGLTLGRAASAGAAAILVIYWVVDYQRRKKRGEDVKIPVISRFMNKKGAGE